jgi:hypothetical protein
METIAIYVVHDPDKMVQEPMAFPTMENAIAYARAECGEATIVIPVPVVRYAGAIHPVDVLMRPTGSTIEEGIVPEERIPDATDLGTVPPEGALPEA